MHVVCTKLDIYIFIICNWRTPLSTFNIQINDIIFAISPMHSTSCFFSKHSVPLFETKHVFHFEDQWIQETQNHQHLLKNLAFQERWVRFALPTMVYDVADTHFASSMFLSFVYKTSLRQNTLWINQINDKWEYNIYLNLKYIWIFLTFSKCSYIFIIMQIRKQNDI